MNIRLRLRSIFIIISVLLALQISYPVVAQNAVGGIGGSLHYPDKNNRYTRFTVPLGKEIESFIKDYWPDEENITKIPSEALIDSHDYMLPLSGHWNWDGQQLRQLSIDYKTASLIFKPIVDSGQIKLDAKFLNADEGMQIIFGFTSPDNFYEIRIGGLSRNAITIMHMNGLNSSAQSSILAKMNFNMSNNQWYNIQVSIDSIQGMVCCAINDMNIEYKANQPIAGRFGVGTAYSNAYFTNISISQFSPKSVNNITDGLVVKPTENQAPSPKTVFSYIKQRFKDIGVNAKWDESANRGYLVNAVTWNSPASKAGIRSDDLIVSINDAEFGKAVEAAENRKFAEQTVYGLGKLPWQMTVERPGAEKPIGMILHPRNNPAQYRAPNIRQSFNPLQNNANPLAVYRSPSEPASPENLKDDKLLNDKKWSDDPIDGIVVIDESSDSLAFRGNWEIKGATFHQTDDDITPAALIFEPIIDTIGEIRLRACAINGNEGVRIVFAYAAANQYLVWNIGGWENKKMVVEKWYGHDRADQHADLTVWQDLIFEHNKWHDIRLVIDAEKSIVKGYVNGKRELLMTTNEPLYGRVGIGTWNTQVEFKDIRIMAGRNYVNAVK